MSLFFPKGSKILPKRGFSPSGVGALRSSGARLSFYMECAQGERGWLRRKRAVLLVVKKRRPSWGATAICTSIRQLGQRSLPVG